MTFTLVRLAVPEPSADEVVAVLGAGSCGARCDPLEDGAIDVQVWFDSPAPAAAALARARAWLDRHDLAHAFPPPVVSAAEEEPWVERFQAGLAPFDLGSRFRVLPRPEAAERDSGRIPLRLTPGRAFGTGEHPTTALSVELLEQSVAPGSRWLDLGCGTAILALVAAHLGASRVEALDNDPEAVAVAHRVLAGNGEPARRVRASCGTLDDVSHPRFDGIAANLALPFFLGHAPALAARLEPGGLVIASGFLDSDVPAVARALRAAGLRAGHAHVRGEWAALAAEREREG